MKKMIMVTMLCLMLVGCNDAGKETPSKTQGMVMYEDVSEEDMSEEMVISVKWDEYEVRYKLNESTAARELYEQLPIMVNVEDFSDNEKIFYLVNELDISDAPLADMGSGTLAYYAPWGDVVFFYGDYRQNSALFALGEAISGIEYISAMRGQITIETHTD